MATTTNPFQQFISGLFGNLSGTSANPVAATSSYAGPYAPGKAPSPSAAPKAGFKGANATYINQYDAINSKAAASGVPYIPATAKGGGMSVMPTSTSAATGKPAASGSGVINPKASPGYVNPLNNPQSTGSAPSSGSTSTSRVSTGSYAPAVASAPAAPAQAPMGSPSGFSYGSPSNSGGGSAMSSGGSDYRKAYTDMLAGMYSKDDLEDASGSLDKLRKQTADAQLFSREEERRIRENEQGQGMKTFSGDLRENTRKSTAELADLAIASAPFDDYIKQAMSASKELYGIGRDEDTTTYNRGRDAAGDALQERKFNEDVRQFGMRHALDQQQESRMASTAIRESKATKDDYIGEFASAFSPGKTMADGTPTVDQNGYITPKAFKAAANEASQYGISRKEFIETFGSQVYTDKKGMPDSQYGLTAVEKKLIAGTTE